MADVRGSGGIMLSQAEQGMKLFKAAEVGEAWAFGIKGVSMCQHLHQMSSPCGIDVNWLLSY